MRALQNLFKPIRIKKSTEITINLNGHPIGNYTLTSCHHSIQVLEKTPKYKINIAHGSGGNTHWISFLFGNQLGNSSPASETYSIYSNENMSIPINISKEAVTRTMALNGFEIDEVIKIK